MPIGTWGVTASEKPWESGLYQEMFEAVFETVELIYNVRCDLSVFIATIMAEQPVVIRKISWAALCPWTIIFRSLPIASSFTVLALALIGVVVTPIGWRVSESVLVNEQMEKDGVFMEIVRSNNSPYRGVFLDVPDGQRSLEVLGVRLTGPREVFRQFVNPFQHMFDRQFGPRHFLYFLLGSLWTVGIWGFVGLAISRVSLVRLTRNEFVPIDEAFHFAIEKWSTVVIAILAPLAAVGVLCLPMFIFGLLMGFDIGAMLVGLFWVLVLAAAAAMGILLLGLMFGWPLMVASVGCESQNSFDAMTRAYAYVFQRPLHYLFYAGLGVLFGGLCWIIVSAFADGVVEMSYWSTSWGANTVGGDRLVQVLVPPVGADAAGEIQTRYIGRNAIGFWVAAVKSLAAAFLYGLFWCMTSAVYLLLRKDVDEAEMDEITLQDEKRTYQLPPLRSDENGIPQVQRPESQLPESDETSSV